MPPQVLMLTFFRLQISVVAVHQLVVALVVRRQVALVHQLVAAVARQQVVVVQRAVALLQAVPQAFAGRIQQTELRLPVQVAITFSFHLPPNEFCS